MTTTKTKNLKIASKKIILPAATFIATFVVSLTVNGGVSTAAALDQIHASREASASVDRLWNIIANVDDNEREWYG